MASSDHDQQQRSRRVAGAATLLGVALIGISFLPAVAGERDRWTNERAREYQDASMQIQIPRSADTPVVRQKFNMSHWHESVRSPCLLNPIDPAANGIKRPLPVLRSD